MPFKGTTYVDWIKSLTPDEHEAHMLERKNRRTIKKSMETVMAKFSDELTAKVFNSLLKQIEKAQDGDTAAFIAAWDRTVGKPKDEIIVDNNMEPPKWNDEF